MEILKDRIIFDANDFVRGLVDRWAVNSVKKLGRGYSYGANFDPVNVLEGYAFPGNLFVDVTNVAAVEGILKDAVVAPGGVYAYLSGTTKLHRLDVTSNTLSNAGAWPHSVAAAGVHAAHTTFIFTNGSVEVYNIAGTAYLFYAWTDNTDWDVGTFDLSATFDDDFMSSVPATPLAGGDLTDGKSEQHNMYVSSNDDLLYLPSGRYAHAFDGGTGGSGTFYSKVMTFPAGFTCKGFAETGYDLVAFICNNAGSNRRGKAYAYFYGADRPADPYKTIDIQDDEVGCPFNYGNTVGCFTLNRSNNRIALRIFNGSKFVAKFFFPGSMPAVGGVEVIDEVVKWNSAGLVYQWGPEGEVPVSAHQTNFVGDTSGFLKALISGTIYSSGAAAGGAGGLMWLDSTKYITSAEIQSLISYPLFPKGKKGKATEIQVHFARAATGGRGLSVRLMTDAKTVNTTIITSVETVAATALVQKFLLTASGGQLPAFKDLAVQLLWNSGTLATDAPGLEKVIIFFRPTII